VIKAHARCVNVDQVSSSPSAARKSIVVITSALNASLNSDDGTPLPPTPPLTPIQVSSVLEDVQAQLEALSAMTPAEAPIIPQPTPAERRTLQMLTMAEKQNTLATHHIDFFCLSLCLAPYTLSELAEALSLPSHTIKGVQKEENDEEEKEEEEEGVPEQLCFVNCTMRHLYDYDVEVLDPR